jgi:hypothetical protein
MRFFRKFHKFFYEFFSILLLGFVEWWVALVDVAVDDWICYEAIFAMTSAMEVMNFD